jgi:hypothetical protein
MPIGISFTFEEVAKLIQTELQQNSTLKVYVDSRNVVICSEKEKDTVPTFDGYLIRLMAPNSGYLQKVPHIGCYYRNNYFVAIELWVKSGSKLAGRISSGKMGMNKGIFEFFQDVSNCLEHNTFNNQLDSYSGTSIGKPIPLGDDNSLIEKVGFVWYGTQNNLK